jgi:hypothetical protein
VALDGARAEEAQRQGRSLMIEARSLFSNLRRELSRRPHVLRLCWLCW